VRGVSFQCDRARRRPQRAVQSEEKRMIVTRKQLSRRTVLKGAAGVAVGLPFLDAMVPALHAQPRRQLRFGAVYVPNGIRPEIWTPPAGEALELVPLLERFEPHRERVNVVTG